MSIKRIVNRNPAIMGLVVHWHYKTVVCISLLLLVSKLLFGELAFSSPNSQIAPQDFYTWCIGENLGKNPPIEGEIIDQTLRVMTRDEHAVADAKTCKSVYKALLIRTKLDLSPVTLIANAIQDLPLEQRVIIDLQPIASLTHLQELNLDDQFLIHDLKPLESLTKLQVLSLANNKIRDITPLSQLKELRKLDLRNNQITDIFALKKLPNLQEVLLSGNELLSPTCPLKNPSSCQFVDRTNSEK